MNTTGIIPPQDLEAEQAVIGAILIDQAVLSKLPDLTPEVFYKEGHRSIIRAILELKAAGEAVDMVTVAGLLRSQNALEGAGGVKYLSQVSNVIPTSANALWHFKIVLEAYKKRQIYDYCLKTFGRLQGEGAELADMTDSLRGLLLNVTSTRATGNIVTLADMAKEEIEHIQARSKHTSDAITGLPTGFIELDTLTDGLQPQELVVIAGRPGMGKTAFGVELMQRAGVPAGIIELEMGKRQVVLRLLAAESGIDMSRLKKGWIRREEWDSLTQAYATLAQRPLVCDFSNGDLRQIESMTEAMIDRHGIKLLLVDYLQLVRVPRSRSRIEEVSEVSRTLKMLAMKHNITVVALAQLSRAVESREDKRPLLSDLRESGQIEQDADVIMFLYSEHYYKKTAPENVLEVIVAKGRNIDTGIVKVYWHKPTMQFGELQEAVNE